MNLEVISINEEFDPNVVKTVNTFTYAKVGNNFTPLKIHCTGEGLSACDSCNNHPRNGEMRTCCCQLGLPKVTC